MQGNQNVIYSLQDGAYLLAGRGFLQVTRSYLLGGWIGNFLVLVKPRGFIKHAFPVG